MKFHQIPIGNAFVYKGKKLKKVNNVMAQDLDSQKQVFMKRSEDVILHEASETPPINAKKPGEELLHQALIDFQRACLNQFKSYRDGVSMDMAEAEINSIREEIFQYYQRKF